MPAWLQYLLWAAGALTALILLWNKVLLPGAKIVSGVADMAPAIDDLRELMKDRQSLAILRQISAQFRTDSGSSLADKVHNLEISATTAATKSAAALEASLEAKAAAASRNAKLDDLVVTVHQIARTASIAGSGYIDVLEDHMGSLEKKITALGGDVPERPERQV